MKSFAAVLLAAVAQAAEVASTNVNAVTLEGAWKVYLTSDGTDMKMELTGPVDADNWTFVAYGKKDGSGFGYVQEHTKASATAAKSVTLASLAATASAGADAEWKDDTDTCNAAKNICKQKRVLTPTGAKATKVVEGTAIEWSWGANATSKDITKAAVLKKGGMVTFTSGKQATLVLDSSVATAVTAATALVASQLF